MGLCQSTEDDNRSPQEKKQAAQEKAINKSLDRQQRNDGHTDKEIKKLLLLGAGESGKSTLFKQMITIYGKGFPDAERKSYTQIIHMNVVSCMVALLDAAPKFGGQIACRDSIDVVREIAAQLPHPVFVNKDNVRHFTGLWNDAAIRAAYDNRSKFQLPDSAEYFFSKLDEIAKDGYIPTQQDVLRSRVRTTGIVENDFLIQGNHFKMFDVGGQRSERKKWIHCFEGVTAVIFVGVLSEYDLMLYEDNTVNRMKETIVLFDEICNSRWFAKTAIILFLNKRDMFEEKIRRVPLSVCPLFANYPGPNTYEAGCALIERTFHEKNKNPQNVIYTHITCATDTSNISVVFDSVKDIIIRRSLGEVGLI